MERREHILEGLPRDQLAACTLAVEARRLNLSFKAEHGVDDAWGSRA
jgi:hypothetical protein